MAEIMIADFYALCLDQRYVVPLGKADIKRAGSDVTVITHGKTVHDSLAAAEELADEIDVEVLDLRSIVTWDAEAMLESVSKTRRVVVVHRPCCAGRGCVHPGALLTRAGSGAPALTGPDRRRLRAVSKS